MVAVPSTPVVTHAVTVSPEGKRNGSPFGVTGCFGPVSLGPKSSTTSVAVPAFMVTSSVLISPDGFSALKVRAPGLTGSFSPSGAVPSSWPSTETRAPLSVLIVAQPTSEVSDAISCSTSLRLAASMS